ncbi:DUF4351 domain-containing protein [Merismopedia glauca]|uniref:DUF4351 domain-containing protein n=1 Tax=Merismopedia glauca TaxID=292586 RepID=UPI001C6268DD|nr:DUF4351 domain-containing protein [Merismopedia glauca]
MSLRTSPAYLEYIERETQKAIQQGVQQGIQQGMQQGRTAEGRELVLKQLTRKLGSLSPELQERVSGLGIEPLESLGEALLDFESVQDLENWLSST